MRRYSSIPPRRVRRLPAPSAPSAPLVPRPVTLPRVDNFNAPLYTFKAFAIATAIVATTATASVAGVMAYLDVRDPSEFAAHMRAYVAQTMPLLTEKIYRRPTSRDVVDGDPLLLAVARNHVPTSTTVDHDAAEQRLAEAFDRGGLDAWAEAAATEMEAEIEVERARKSRTT